MAGPSTSPRWARPTRPTAGVRTSRVAAARGALPRGHGLPAGNESAHIHRVARGPITLVIGTRLVGNSANNTATAADNDYQAQSESVTVAPGGASKTVTIGVKSDGRRG